MFLSRVAKKIFGDLGKVLVMGIMLALLYSAVWYIGWFANLVTPWGQPSEFYPACGFFTIVFVGLFCFLFYFILEAYRGIRDYVIHLYYTGKGIPTPGRYEPDSEKQCGAEKFMLCSCTLGKGHLGNHMMHNERTRKIVREWFDETEGQDNG